MGKNGHNEGSIRNRPDRKWEARYTAGRNELGRQIQRSIYGKTRTEVAKKLNDVLNKLHAGQYIAPNKITLSEWLTTWLKEYASVTLRPSTYISYEGYIHNHINPIMGGIPLKNLTTDRLQVFYNEKSESGRLDGKGGLSPKTLRNLHNMLHKALEQACKNNMIASNVSDNTILPKRENKEMRVLSRSEQKTLLQHIDSERLGFAILLDLSTGMRIGELCGLKWNDIDFDRKVLFIRRTLQRVKTSIAELENSNAPKTMILEGNVKTDNSYREVPIQEKIFIKLLEYQKRQQQEKTLASSAYDDNDYIFATQLGGVIEPSTMRDMYNRLLKQAGISHANFHALRHTFATRAIESGVPIKAVSDILGHATVQLTMDLYCHSSIDLKREAVDKMAELW
ncbi:site-specific integrase [Paludicola sp. MB14-C6]|uniref:tyrosine-type recombinase/integrase n=1 Tax=Paludihabitans sp. MB14-C6 TaxID=3070656 RepID=UPI0027DC0747|nr:site-specific integrase [Paludicola sp. MB14-C6]WMJ22194.1 site-specific integrase [Paludicola sp. MB14-C6]